MEGEENEGSTSGGGDNNSVLRSEDHPLELQVHSDSDSGEEDEEEEEEEEDTNNNNDGGEADEEEGGEGEYRFRFEGEMDPLAFAEDDAFGTQPYQQFERLENQYEALAARKRKARAELQPQRSAAKKLRHEDVFEEMLELMNYGKRRRSRRSKRKGRRKGSKSKVHPDVLKKLGDANLHYALGRYEEAISVLKEVIRLSPNLSDPYHTLGLIYNSMGDKKRALNFYMLAAHLAPKDVSLWKLLVTWSLEHDNRGQARYCLSKAISADPEDTSLRFDRAFLYGELGDFQKAAESYEQIVRLRPDNIGVLRTAAELYLKCGQHKHAVSMLEDYLEKNQNEHYFDVVHLLAEVHMEVNAYVKALEHIQHAQKVHSAGKEMPLNLTIKSGICHAHLGNLEQAYDIFSVLQDGNQPEHLIIEVADSLMSLKQYESALKYYMTLDKIDEKNDGSLNLKVSKCCEFVGKKLEAIKYLYKAVNNLEDSVDARLDLSSLLLEYGKDDEAISVLSPPAESDVSCNQSSDKVKPWWLSGMIKLKLCQIYQAKGLLEDFVDVILPVIRETLFIETVQQKVPAKKRLSKSVLSERIKVVNESQTDHVFHRFRPVALASDLAKASRARKILQKKATRREASRAAALAAGIDWKSDDSDNESPQDLREPPLPNLLKEDKYHLLIIDLCKALSSLRKYWEALEVINLTLKLAFNTLSIERRKELRTLGAQIAYNIADPTHGWDCARYVVNQHLYSFAAWNCYYKVMSRLGIRFSRHNKFLHGIRVKHKDCVPPIIISGHQYTSLNQHQAAAREYLEAYKLLPDNPLINLSIGSALISLTLGHRLQNKHQCILQGLSFLYNNLRICENSQEALYNIARAYHHVGMVSLAVKYYEKVLAVHVSDYPIPKLPNEDPDTKEHRNPGYCDLHREAAYNLHLIYKKSGALDLARQVLKDYCTL